MRPALLFVTFLAFLAAVLFLLNSNPPTSSAQTDALAAQEEAVAINPDPPGTIDGAKNPELIPDKVAHRMFFLAVAEPPNASEVEKERARGKLAQADLSEDDLAALLTLLGEFHGNIEAIHSEVGEILTRAPFPHQDSPEFKRLVELRKQRDIVVANTRAALPARLSYEGMEKLHAHVQATKRGMKIIPGGTENLMPPGARP